MMWEKKTLIDRVRIEINSVHMKSKYSCIDCEQAEYKYGSLENLRSKLANIRRAREYEPSHTSGILDLSGNLTRYLPSSLRFTVDL